MPDLRELMVAAGDAVLQSAPARHHIWRQWHGRAAASGILFTHFNRKHVDFHTEAALAALQTMKFPVRTCSHVRSVTWQHTNDCCGVCVAQRLTYSASL